MQMPLRFEEFFAAHYEPVRRALALAVRASAVLAGRLFFVSVFAALLFAVSALVVRGGDIAAFSAVATAGGPSALLRAAALRGLARWGRARGSDARIPPSGTASACPLGLGGSLILSQSSRTGVLRAKHAIPHPFCVWSR